VVIAKIHFKEQGHKTKQTGRQVGGLTRQLGLTALLWARLLCFVPATKALALASGFCTNLEQSFF
jgi:hypothetical protein